MLTRTDSVDVGALLQHLPGEKEAQQILLDLVERPILAIPGQLFDGAIQFFERQRKTEQRHRLQEQHQAPLRRGDPGAILDYLAQYQKGREQDWRERGA